MFFMAALLRLSLIVGGGYGYRPGIIDIVNDLTAHAALVLLGCECVKHYAYQVCKRHGVYSQALSYQAPQQGAKAAG
jgi:hypothetical protein